MAHFAELDENNIVLRVIVVANADCLDNDGNESEAVGVNFITEHIGLKGVWKQTSFNNNFRGLYAGIGWLYDSTKDEFIEPVPKEPPKVEAPLK
jgi:hypothetical protein